MINLIIFILVSYGLSNIFTQSIGPFRVFEKIREYAQYLPSNLGDAFGCMICFPTWVGMGLSLLNMLLFKEIYFTPFYSIIQDTSYWWLIFILDGCIASGTTWFLHNIEEWFENKTHNDFDDGE